MTLATVGTIDYGVEREFDGEEHLNLLFDRHGIDIEIKGVGSLRITPQMLAWINANDERYHRMLGQLDQHAIEPQDHDRSTAE